MSFWLLISLVLFSWRPVLAAETDNFTYRYLQKGDAIPQLNLEIKRRLDQVINVLNLSQNISGTCQWEELSSLLGQQLRHPFKGQIEDFISSSPTLPKSIPDFDNSIFKNVPSLHKYPIQVGRWLGIGFTGSIHHDGLLIGADKFGHFIDEGYYYYYLRHEWDFDFSQVLKFGEFMEYSFEGKLTGGIYSYADLAANYDGQQFWLDLLGSEKQQIQSKFFSCHDGIWQQLRPVDFALYVSPAWDEGMNCNEYRSSGMQEGIEKTILELESRDKKRYACPVYPERVHAMVTRYNKEHVTSLINPGLLKIQ